MLQTTPFLLFDGNCAEAMTFYHKCLGGYLTLTKLADTPMKDMPPKEKHNRIINAISRTVLSTYQPPIGWHLQCTSQNRATLLLFSS